MPLIQTGRENIYGSIFLSMERESDLSLFQLGKFSHDEAIPKTIDRNIAQLHQLVCSFPFNSLVFISQRPYEKTIFFCNVNLFKRIVAKVMDSWMPFVGERIWPNSILQILETHYIALKFVFEIYNIYWERKNMKYFIICPNDTCLQKEPCHVILILIICYMIKIVINGCPISAD